MKVAILQCDEVLEKFQPEFGSYNNMIMKMFNEFNGPFMFKTFDCQQGQYPDDIHTFDFYITTGSKSGVYEDKPWVEELIQFVQLLDRHKKKLIGICFGHQIIAMAFNGQVNKSDKGWGVGIANNRVVSTPDWMTNPKPDLNIIVSHQDQISQLPENAKIIAESDFCPYFMVQWNDHFLSIQGHPEWNAKYSQTLMNNRRDIIPENIIDAGIQSLDQEPDNSLFTQWIMDFVRT